MMKKVAKKMAKKATKKVAKKADAALKKQMEECQSKGGHFDEASKACHMPEAMESHEGHEGGAASEGGN